MATALYAGLRLGELKALQWQDVDFAAGIIHVHRSWDRHTGPITPKSRAGTRKVPLSQPLRIHLAKHRLAHHHQHSELAFARANGQPFTQAITNRARQAWNNARLQPIGPHQCRHTYASYMIAAGINAKASPPTWATPASPPPSTTTDTSRPATNTKPPQCSPPT